MTCDIDDVAIDDLLVSIVCPTVREVCLNQSKMNVIFGYKIKHPIYCCTESSIWYSKYVGHVEKVEVIGSYSDFGISNTKYQVFLAHISLKIFKKRENISCQGCASSFWMH